MTPAGSPHPSRRYPRTARVNEVLREVIASELELVVDDDDRLSMITITGVEVEPDLHSATVFFTGLDERADEALRQQRVRLQTAVGREVRLKRTPRLSFAPDPGVRSGRRVDEILRGLESRGE